jgi:hypothetical protein
VKTVFPDLFTEAALFLFSANVRETQPLGTGFFHFLGDGVCDTQFMVLELVSVLETVYVFVKPSKIGESLTFVLNFCEGRAGRDRLSY